MELLITIGIIGILASIVVVAVNPAEQLLKARDAKRNSTARELNDALSQYFIEEGELPGGSEIKVGEVDAARPICKEGISHATCINIDALTPDYIVSIPQDDREPCTNHSGFKIYKDEDGRPYVVSSRIQEIGGLTTCLWNDLVGYWSMHEKMGTSAFDLTGGGQNGTLENSPSWAEGNVGGGIRFDGTSDRHILVPDSSNFDYTNGLTYSAWIYPTGFPDTFNMFMGEMLPYFNVRSSQQLHFSFRAGGAQRSAYGSSIPSADQWYHVAATVDDTGKAIVYLDGVPSVESDAYGAIYDYGYPHYIGKWTSNSDGLFTGIVDEVRIYNRALSSTEIEALVAGATD